MHLNILGGSIYPEQAQRVEGYPSTALRVNAPKMFRCNLGRI